MHPTIIILSAAAVMLQATLASAEHLTVLVKRVSSTWHYNSAIWNTDFSAYPTDSSTGCRNPGVLTVPTACYDWWPAGGAAPRGHFEATGQPKRCWEQKYWDSIPCPGEGILTDCYMSRWREVGCSW